MKIITYSRVGYNHPSQANWSYGVWKIDLLDTKREYCTSFTVKETFGGDSRFRDKVNLIKKSLGDCFKLIEVKGIFECPKITGVSKMYDIEGEELYTEVYDFINKI